MSRALVADVLLPLLVGGELHVGRPWTRSRLAASRREVAEGVATGRPRLPREVEALRRFIAERQLRARALFGDVVAQTVVAADASSPELDEDSWRLGAAVHNLLALSHPAWAGKRLIAGWQAQVISESLALAEVGPPATLLAAVRRHLLLASLPEVGRQDATVRYWLGQRSFVGQSPPARLLSWPRLRRVEVETQRKSWLREVGVPPAARAVILALATASPLDETGEPLRLDPPFCWARVLHVLKFPSLARWVSRRLLAPGFERAMPGLADALLRFALVQEPDAPTAATPEAVAFAVRFLAHLAWLDLLFRPEPHLTSSPSLTTAPGEGPPPSGAAPGPPAPTFALEALLVAAAVERPTLLWPPDIRPHSPEAAPMHAQIAAWQFRLAAATMDSSSQALATWAAAHSVVRSLPEAPASPALPAL